MVSDTKFHWICKYPSIYSVNAKRKYETRTHLTIHGLYSGIIPLEPFSGLRSFLLVSEITAKLDFENYSTRQNEPGDD